MGMCHANFGGIVTPAMVPFCKDVDGIHISCNEGFLELFLVEQGSDTVDMLRGVEVQVDLPGSLPKLACVEYFGLEFCAGYRGQTQDDDGEKVVFHSESVSRYFSNVEKYPLL
jgi:hypothetical protein